MPDRLSREEHALRHGPTAGDRVRLADTDLWIRIERDLTEPGDQALWGYAKNWRSRMTQHDAATRASELDAVIGSVIVVDPLLGVVKCDLGIKDGRIAGIGRAGNPDITDGVDLTIGPNTWPIPCHGLIATPAVVDSHVHLLSPRLVPVALSAGVTTLITAGFEEPPDRMAATYAAFEHVPVNIGLQPSARTDVAGGLDAAIEAGAVGLKIHEDWGAYPEIIDATLRAADAHDIAVCLHTDSLNESTELEGTVEAIAGRTIHAYHVEGSGGGHIPDALGLVREPNVFCSSTTPTLPYGPATAAEQLDMKLIVHEGNPSLPEDVAAALELVHPATMAAEGPLHELGAIQIVNSDSQGMGRIGETLRRTFQLADAMKRWAEDASPDDNERVLRYLAKVTTEPSIVHGIAGKVGSLSPGRMADIVLWWPTHFGVKPVMVIKGGVVAWSAMGEGNASVHGAEPTRYGPDWGGLGGAPARLSTTFVSQAALDAGFAETTARSVVPVRGTRGITRDALTWNTAAPSGFAISPVDGAVTLDGRVLACEPTVTVPMSRRYLLA
ncbi:MAG: urease subunit alpha [Actinomycetota bacterium]